MTKRTSIPVFPDQMPYNQNLDIGGEEFQLAWQWNDIDRHFTVDIARADGTSIYKGEVIIWGQALWRLINFPGLPTDQIVPIDESGNEHDVDPGTFGNTVLPLIDDVDSNDLGDDDSGT